ncbi:MAG: amidohydrolase, partial [Firmicutes bacterium]|nr:amidohydrolase [Bacillota bacterium]
MMQKAQKMFYNGKIYTVDSNESVQSAFCIYDDRFMAVGSDEEMLALCDESTEKVDLKGQVVVPGLIDTHLHVVHTGTIKMQLDLHGMDKQVILEQVKQVAQNLEPG